MVVMRSHGAVSVNMRLISSICATRLPLLACFLEDRLDRPSVAHLASATGFCLFLERVRH